MPFQFCAFPFCDKFPVYRAGGRTGCKSIGLSPSKLCERPVRRKKEKKENVKGVGKKKRKRYIKRKVAVANSRLQFATSDGENERKRAQNCVPRVGNLQDDYQRLDD